ncbi:MAG TPA: four helix bundle protein [Vicinamibacterales bacterium]|nr:four helix bundle protein [Vicinamibacterales bacterium]
MTITHFKELMVWQQAMELAVNVYKVTDAYPRSELFVLTSQTRKSAISIPSNIAEGCSRRSTPSFINHVHIALGSEAELFTQLELALRLGLATREQLAHVFAALQSVGKMMNALATSLEATRTGD